VPLTIFVDTPCTATVPVPAGNVMVPEAVAEADRVVVPEDEPLIIRFPTVVFPLIVWPPAVVRTVPLVAGNVSAVVPATAGASIVT
jgi:hypothetical protein